MISRRNFIKAGIGVGAALAIGRPKLSLAENPPATRIVGVHADDCNSWNGSSLWFGSNTYVSQSVVDVMVRTGVKRLTNLASELDAWTVLFPTVSGSTKVGIKLNENNFEQGIGNNIIDWTPQVVNAVIKGLKVRGFTESNIYLFCPTVTTGLSASYHTLVSALYPSVQHWGSQWEAVYNACTWGSADSSLTVTHDFGTSKLPDQLLDMNYLIQMPQLKAHGSYGVTFTYKNLLGFKVRSTIDALHGHLLDSSQNPLCDLWANSNIGAKTKLIVGDAIYGNHTSNMTAPSVWSVMANHWPDRLFFSVNPVAIDCVMYDFVDWQNNRTEPTHENYLIDAAGRGHGTREHWNNSTDKQYSTLSFLQYESGDEPSGDSPAKVQGVSISGGSLR